MLAGLFLVSAPAHADSSCSLAINAQDVSLTWGLNFSFQAVTFSVSKSSNPACSYGITFTQGQSPDYNRYMTSGVSRLSYQLFKDPALTYVLRDVPNLTSANDYIAGSFSGGSPQSQALSYYVQIPFTAATTPTLKPPGTYQDVVTIKAYQGSTLTQFAAPLATKSVVITTSIPRIIEISLVPTGGIFDPTQTSRTVDFGVLTTGAVQALDVLVRSNAGYRVTLSSQNGGVMKNSSGTIQTNIPYTIAANGTSTSLGSPVALPSGSGQTALNGVRIPLSVTIGDVSGAMAGQYTDSITVTATTTE
jgi:hypothetical protein